MILVDVADSELVYERIFYLRCQRHFARERFSELRLRLCFDIILVKKLFLNSKRLNYLTCHLSCDRNTMKSEINDMNIYPINQAFTVISL